MATVFDIKTDTWHDITQDEVHNLLHQKMKYLRLRLLLLAKYPDLLRDLEKELDGEQLK